MPKNDSVVEPEILVEDFIPIDEICMDIMKHGGKSYLVIADKATG